MMRLLGFVTGSAVSIGAILLILGIPEFHLSNPHLDKGRFDEALQNLKDRQREVALAASTVGPVGEEPGEPASAADVAADASAEQSVAMQAPLLPADSDEFDLPQKLHWHTFWNPFRSEQAARGFVSQLERVTGLDYRIVRIKSGVYEVSFAYESDLERQAKLSQIHAATGLDLPGR